MYIVTLLKIFLTIKKYCLLVSFLGFRRSIILSLVCPWNRLFIKWPNTKFLETSNSSKSSFSTKIDSLPLEQAINRIKSLFRNKIRWFFVNLIQQNRILISKEIEKESSIQENHKFYRSVKSNVDWTLFFKYFKAIRFFLSYNFRMKCIMRTKRYKRLNFYKIR